MAEISMTWSVPSLLTSSSKSKLPRVNRYPGMSFATANKVDTAASTLGVSLTQGLGNLPNIVLTYSHGSEAEIYLYGGCVTSWKFGTKDLLFVRPDVVFNGQKPWRNPTLFPTVWTWPTSTGLLVILPIWIWIAFICHKPQLQTYLVGIDSMDLQGIATGPLLILKMWMDLLLSL